jgi:hypothetical protein
MGKIRKWRREGDSNPRFPSLGITVFKTAAFNRSAISPKSSEIIAEKIILATGLRCYFLAKSCPN